MMTAPSLQQVALMDLLIGVDVIGDVPPVMIRAVSMDSRCVTAGSLFLACAGQQTHGLEYLQQAVVNGASAVLAEVSSCYLPEDIARLSSDVGVPVIPVSELTSIVSLIAGRFYQHPSRKIPVIGITGTNGKSSSSLFIANAFADIRKVAVLGTLGNGFPEELQPSTHTTMDPVSVQSTLAALYVRQAEMVAMEVSSHALHQGRVADVDFDMAVLTNFSRDHLDYHGTMADYAEAKSLLFKMSSLKSTLINADDELGQRLIKDLENSPVRVVAYAMQATSQSLKDLSGVDAWIKAHDVELSTSGVRFGLESSWGNADIELPLMGRFNVYNACVALGVMLECGVEFEQALEGLRRLKSVNGRMEVFRTADKPVVVVDFAHTPDALEQALSSLRSHVDGKLFCVFGCGGDRDKGKRPLMGAIAERKADSVMLTSDNPRSEDPMQIIDDILKGFSQPEKAIIESSRARAIELAIKNAGPGDLVLVAGKGHENVQVVGDLKIPFSDQQTVISVLEGM